MLAKSKGPFTWNTVDFRREQYLRGFRFIIAGESGREICEAICAGALVTARTISESRQAPFAGLYESGEMGPIMWADGTPLEA